MLDQKQITTLPLIDFSFEQLVQANLPRVIEYLTAMEANDCNYAQCNEKLGLVYDFNLLTQNTQAYQLAFDNCLALANIGLHSKRQGQNNQTWATQIIKSYYYEVEQLKLLQTQLLPTLNNLYITNKLLAKNKQVFTPQSYINWIMPLLLKANQIKLPKMLFALIYMRFDRNYFAMTLMKQSDWEKKLIQSKNLRWIVYQVMELNPRLEHEHPTPTIMYILQQLRHQDPSNKKYIDLYNRYSLAR